ncbi:MAG: TIGR02186 family protein [Alphaproteobacteria bacterium]|nr:TIGR02186 family protein [Alphaproteobacteria bacterium]
MIRHTSSLWLILLTAVLLDAPSSAYAQDDTTFAVDLADRQISITAGFNGANLLIFGAITRGDVILIIEGTTENYQVRKKKYVGGIWINSEAHKLHSLPNFYVVASSNGALEQLPTSKRIDHRIGYDAITQEIPTFDAHAREFFDSLVRIKEQDGLYQFLPDTIEVANSGLFRINIQIPAAIPPGDYVIRALSIENGEILQKFQTALSVNKVGFGAEIYRAAHQYPKLYGISAIIISVFSGLLANFIFNRRKA